MFLLQLFTRHRYLELHSFKECPLEKQLKQSFSVFTYSFLSSKLFAYVAVQYVTTISLCGFIHNQHLMSFLSLSLEGFSLALSLCFCCSCKSGLLVRLFTDVPGFGWYGFVGRFGGVSLAAIVKARGLKECF